MKATINSVEYWLPDNKLTNEQLEKEGVYTADKIFDKTGISERRIASDEQTSSDLAYNAAEKLFKANDIDKDSVDMLLFCTQSPDYFLPTSACILQDRLGLPTTIGALDYNLGCSGYIYGLHMAKAYIESGLAQRVLLLTGETYSKSINPGDKSNRTIFGDAGTATLIEGIESNEELIKGFVLGTDGRGKDNLIIPDGGFRNRYSDKSEKEHEDSAGNIRSDADLFMDGSKIFTFTIRVVPSIVNKCLEKNNMKADDIDYFLMHQANKFIIDYLSKKMKLPQSKVLLNLKYVGNTVSNTIPLLMKMKMDEGVLKRGMTLMTIGFGVGYSYGANIIKL